MNGYGEDNPYCYFHPNEFVVGVCAVCLRERLLILASKQGHHQLSKESRKFSRASKRQPVISTLPKVFALGALLHFLESRHSSHRDEDSDKEEGSIASLEDCFISIKFEDNGHATWEKKTPSADQQSMSTTTTTNNGNAIGKNSKEEVKSMVELPKRAGAGASALRWRKRIGHILQLSRWKRSSKGSACHVGLGGKVEVGIKGGGRRGWIRSLTRRTTNTTTS